MDKFGAKIHGYLQTTKINNPVGTTTPPKQTITWLPMHQAIDSIGFTTWS